MSMEVRRRVTQRRVLGSESFPLGGQALEAQGRGWTARGGAAWG